MKVWIISMFVVAGHTVSAQFGLPNLPAEDDSTREHRILTSAPRVVLSQVAVRLELGIDPHAFAARNGMRLHDTFRSDPQHHVFITQRPAAETDEIAIRLRAVPGVLQSDPVEISRVVPLNFFPNDPLFVGSGSAKQWHLHNSMFNVNIVPAWARNLTGQGVLIGIIDDGLEAIHPDLVANFSLADSFNWVTNSQNPSPTLATEGHGTSVAGVAAARGGNSIGVTGAAPFARVGGLKLEFGESTTAQFADAVKYRSSGALRAYGVKNHSYGYRSPFFNDDLNVAAVAESASAGTLHVFSAGNSRGATTQDSAKQEQLNQTGAIVVAALGEKGVFSDYSSFGSNVFVTAPSSSEGLLGVTTTDRMGTPGYNGITDQMDYTSLFGGTSSAAPLVAGILALVREVNPSAESRIVKHNLARTSRIVDPDDATTSSDGGWKLNAGGLRFNQNYGFGLIDASALTLASFQYPRATARTVYDSGLVSGGPIPVNSSIPKSIKFTNPSSSGRVEDVLLTVNVDHPRRGDLQIFVTSPSGTQSRVCIRSGSDWAADMAWTFLSNAFWGEPAGGTWTAEIFDAYSPGSGTVINARLVVNMGQRVGRQNINGTVVLGDFLGNVDAEDVEVRVFRPGSTTASATTTLNLNSAGRFTWNPELVDGTYDIAVTGGHWLRRRINGVNLTASLTTSRTFTLRNGDVDSDNEVTIFDYILLSQNFGLLVGSSATDPNADLDGDGEVTIFDYIILSQNFGLQGD